MKLPKPIHRWDVSPKEAVEIQRRFAGEVIRAPLGRRPRWVAGVDCAVDAERGRCYAAAVVWDLRDGRIAESRTAARPLEFPYVPGLLSFREIPVILEALDRLQTTPDVLMCDGQGYAHPRRFGLACHLGVAAGAPSFGCAKSRLIGEHASPAVGRGARAALYDRGELIGEVVRSRTGVRPLYVSIGHRIDLSTAVALVLACSAGYRLPEPTRQADRLVGEFKRREQRS